MKILIKQIAKKILFCLHILDQNEYRLKVLNAELNHPERLAVLPYCEKGRGADIGCGNRKTNDNCIGIDIIPKGKHGTIGSVAGQISEADFCASGDELTMFLDNELDFVVARHNLEHYVDVIKTLKEWRRVLKQDGILAVVLPDEEGLNRVGKRSVMIDPTHEHSFTQKSFQNMISMLGGFDIIRLEVVIPNWSFICVCRKI